MSMPGIYELMIIFGVAILFFGGKKLPALGSALGESIKNFKAGIKESAEDTSNKDNINKDKTA
jgi:sec-independent protein translocase protein TatA